MIQKGNFKVNLELRSVNPSGFHAITFTHTHERAVHSELMTHRVSRNASSSRAIPWKRMKAWIRRDPAMPLHMGANKPGMQSGGLIDDPEGARRAILDILDADEAAADALVEKYDLHKEIVNRYVEAFGWINCVSTWSLPAFMNFCALRMTRYAEPRIQRLAVNMAREFVASTPQILNSGDWHLPFVRDHHDQSIPINIQAIGDERLGILIRWSVARAAWTSYQTVEEKDATYVEAVRRHDDCVSLKHATPCEHQKRANADGSRNGGTTPGFDEYRHMIPGESVPYVDLVALLEGPYKDRDFIVG